MTKRDWMWTVVWLLLLIAAFGTGKDDCNGAARNLITRLIMPGR